MGQHGCAAAAFQQCALQRLPAPAPSQHAHGVTRLTGQPNSEFPGTAELLYHVVLVVHTPAQATQHSCSELSLNFTLIKLLFTLAIHSSLLLIYRAVSTTLLHRSVSQGYRKLWPVPVKCDGFARVVTGESASLVLASPPSPT